MMLKVVEFLIDLILKSAGAQNKDQYDSVYVQHDLESEKEWQ